MAGFSLEFHAPRSELAPLIARWIDERGLWLAYETLTPAYSSTLVARGGLAGELDLPSEIDRIVLSREAVDMTPGGPFGLIKHNPSAASILLGRESSSALGSSVLQAGTDDKAALSEWRRIRRQLTAAFHRGARVTNSMTGKSGSVTNHYFSPGAEALFAGGVRMAGPTDVLVYEPV